MKDGFIISQFIKYYDKKMENDMCEACSTHEIYDKGIQILNQKTEMKVITWKQDANIKMDL
jgi:hypothetical protein